MQRRWGLASKGVSACDTFLTSRSFQSIQSIHGILLAGGFELSSASIRGWLDDIVDWGRLPPPPARVLLVVDDDDHPDTNLTVAADERRAMDPLGPAFFVGLGDPSYFGRHSSPFGKCGCELLSDSI